MNIFSILSFLSNVNNPPMPIIICILWRLQMLAYILPNDGWSKLNYSDANFQILQNISQALLIAPICSLNIQYVLLTIFALAHLSGLFVYIILIFDLEFIIKRGYRGALIVYNQFILLNNQILMLPQYFLYLTFIFELNPLPSIVSSFLLFMVAFYNIFGSYFLRCYQFQFKSELCLKYSVFQNLEQILFLGLNMIYIQANSNTFTFIALIMIHLINVLKMRKIIMEEPHTIRLNVQIFKIIVMLEFINSVITLQVAYDQIDVTKNILLTSIMIYGSLGYYIGSVYIESFICVPFEEIHNHNVVSHCQRMFQFSNKQRHNPKYFFLIQYYLQHHYDRCRIPLKDNKDKSVKQIIQCTLSSQLINARSNNKELYEDLQLAYISFLADQCKKPLMAFIELRKYQQQSETKTYFYQFSQIHIAQGMQDQIRKQQKLYIDFDKHLDISQISKAINLEQALIPKYLQIIDLKINLWQHQIKGLNTIYNLQDLALELSSKIDSTDQYLRENISQNTTNVVQLRLLSIFNCAVMNDFSQTNFYEQIIQDILNNEQSSDNITNLKIIEEKATYIMISMVKMRGNTLNSNKKSLLQYFKSENMEYHHLSQIMPQFFSEIHDSLLAHYLSTSQSKFLSQFVCVFGLSGGGFILPQLLKIDHNFTIMDDYVLTGILSRFRENSDYILFNQEGTIIGITQNLYDVYFHQMIDYKMLCKTFIYMFIPTIIIFLNFFRGQQEKLGEDFILEENTQLSLYLNFNDIHKKYQSLNIIVPHRRQIQSYSSKFFKSEQSNTGKSIMSLGDENEQSIGLYETLYQDQIGQFINNIDNIDCQKYNIRFQLSQQQVGRDNYKKQFFVLEILDIKQDRPGESSLFISNFSSRKPPSNSLHFSQNISELNAIDKDLQVENTPNQRLDQNYSQLIKRYDKKPELNLNLIDSAREDHSYGPISQRVNFISPTSKQENFDNMLEKDFIDLQIQIANISNIEVPDQDPEPEPDQLSRNDQDNKQSSSQDKNQNSQKVLEIMRQTKLNGRDFEPNNSKSSKTSGTSGATAIHLIRKFQQLRSLLPSLKIIMFNNLMVLVGILTILIIHLQVTQKDNQYTLQMLNDINGPLLFNRYFFNLFQCSWSLVYNSLGIIKSSDYLLNRILEAIKNLEQTLFYDLDALYKTFVSIEQRGLLSPIPMYVLYSGNMDVDYTYFVNFIQDLAKTLLTASNYNITNLSKLITTEYTNALLCLRYNLKDVNIMINELISSLNIIFFSEQQRLVDVYKQQVIIEVLVLGFIISLQLYFWFKIEKYIQQLLLLLGRLQESQAQIMITKMLYIKDILQQQTGKYSWKRQNFNIIYFKQHQSLQLNELGPNKQIKRAYLNVVLNQRVYKTQIQILTPLLFVLITYSIILLYLFGGFLIYQQQVSDLSPSQQLTQNYIQFSYLLDTVTTCAFIIKTQPVMYDAMANQKLYENSTLDTFRDGGIVFKIFNNIYSNYTENMTTIVENIVESTRISDQDKKQLFSLYQQSFCGLIADQLPFCSDPPYDQLVQDYGQYEQNDINSDYYSQGIQGIISKLNFMFITLYSYEINNSAYILDRTILKQQSGSKEFSNAIFEHFLDTTKGTNLFLKIIQQSTQDIMNNNLEQIYLYYTILGSCILVAYILCFTFWIYRTHMRIIYLRLSLTNLPIEILTENNTLSLLKRMLY